MRGGGQKWEEDCSSETRPHPLHGNVKVDPRPSLSFLSRHAALLPTWGGALPSELAALRDETKAWTREGRKVEKASSSLCVFQRAACTKITDACYAGYYERDYPQPKDRLV